MGDAIDATEQYEAHKRAFLDFLDPQVIECVLITNEGHSYTWTCAHPPQNGHDYMDKIKLMLLTKKLIARVSMPAEVAQGGSEL
jgi:hypothetical protein